MSEPTVVFGVGATRAGTSWLHRYLSDHPEGHFRGVKEAHWFDTLEWGNFDFRLRVLRRNRARIAAKLDYARADPWRAKVLRNLAAHDELIALFERRRADHAGYMAWLCEGRPEGARLVGDITPAYGLIGTSSLKLMRQIAGAARFVYILRDPVTRLWSNVRQVAAGRPEARAGDLEGAARQVFEGWLDGREPAITLRCDYRDTLERIDDALDPAQVLVLFYETLFSDESLDRLTRFLGIGPAPGQTDRRVHAGEAVPLPPGLDSAARARLAPQYDYVRARFGAQVPAHWAAPITEGAR